MAKQVVSPIERHVEKVVLGLMGIGLIAVIAMYLVTSPNQIELAGEMVTPSTIDEKLARKATDVRMRIRNLEPDDPGFEPLEGTFAAALNPFDGDRLSDELAAVVRIGPDVPIIDPPGRIAGQAKLTDVVPFDKPLITHGRSTFEITGEYENSYVVSNWVTISSLFNRAEQVRLQADAYGSQRSEVIFGPAEVQKRAQRPDGTWSDDDWETVRAWPAFPMPQEPAIPFEEEDGVIFVPSDERGAVDRYQGAIVEPLTQLEIIRPQMVTVFNGTEWEIPPVVPYIELLRMDDEYIHPNLLEPIPDAELEDRYGLMETPVAADAGTSAGASSNADEIEALFDTARKLADKARTDRSATDAMLAYNTYIDIYRHVNASASQKMQAERLADEVDQLRKDIIREKRNERRGGVREETPDESYDERVLLPKQQVWAHCAAPGVLQSGRTYQLRIRATLYNRLVAEPDKFANIEDARVLYVAGDWSEPSEPIVFETTSCYFITGADPRRDGAKVEFYQWFDGYWVTTRATFGLGDRIALSKRVPIGVPGAPNEVDRPEVTFDPGATVVSIEFEHPYRERKARGGGIRFQPTLSRECAVVLVDSEGRLTERFAPTDKAHNGKKALADRVFKVPRGGN